MPDRIEQIATPSGTMETFIAAPGAAVRGAVILYMDVWGIRDELYAIARDVARTGLLCLLPDLFYREGRVRHRFVDAHGRLRSLLSLTADEQEQVRGPMRRLSDDMAMSDTRAILAHLGSASKGVAAIGYCMGGRHALLAGGSFPEAIKVAASLHGSNLVTDHADSPHVVASRIKGEAYCGFAQHDPFGAQHVIESIARQFSSAGAKLGYHIHDGAQHGYALPERDVYDAAATATDWTEIHRLIARHLV